MAEGAGEWTCRACTFINENPDGLVCKICRTERREDEERQICESLDRRESSNRYEKLPRLVGNGNKKHDDADDDSNVDLKPTKKRSDRQTSNPSVVYLEEISDDEDGDEHDNCIALGSNGKEGQWRPTPMHNPYRKEEIAKQKTETTSMGSTSLVNPYRQDVKRPCSQAIASAPNDLTKRANALLRAHWGESFCFKPFQIRTIEALAHGRDVLVVSGTGSGKSICFQIPPLLRPGGVAVVVSPLISLMRDQCGTLARRGIRAEYLGSGQKDPEAEKRALRGEASVIFVCPESLPRIGAALGRLHDLLLADDNVRNGAGTSPMILAV